ncbi:heavy-metal-associated domain-containing protein [Microscilla marina]|uniref:heavy-metal-associated domain-containing protein n=1 Tax=Microscilla marina TaxID=1027 RepID=UPI0002D6F63A|nr:hypothetical protein [Microscilla marina]
MNTLKFKTNIQCNGCLTKVTPHLNQLEAIKDWEVDLKSLNRVLTVRTATNEAQEQVIDKLKAIGFFAREI